LAPRSVATGHRPGQISSPGHNGVASAQIGFSPDKVGLSLDKVRLTKDKGS
jgi:hypothetical protein